MATTNTEQIKMSRIGTSYFLIVPYEFIKIFNLLQDENENQYTYSIKVSQNGKRIIYEQNEIKQNKKENDN